MSKRTTILSRSDSSGIDLLGPVSSNDPIEGNPFPEGDVRHKVWEDATRKAEEELCRLDSDVLKTRTDSPDAAVSWMRSVVVGKFNIWAKRGIHVVWNDGAVQAYDQWLTNYAREWLDCVNAAEPFRAVVPLDSLLSELRLCLMERVAWWQAEARRYVAQQRKQAQENLEIPQPKKKRGRPPGGRRGPLYERVKKVWKERGASVKPADLLELPQIKELAQDYENPSGEVAKVLSRVRKEFSRK